MSIPEPQKLSELGLVEPKPSNIGQVEPKPSDLGQLLVPEVPEPKDQDVVCSLDQTTRNQMNDLASSEVVSRFSAAKPCVQASGSIASALEDKHEIGPDKPYSSSLPSLSSLSLRIPARESNKRARVEEHESTNSLTNSPTNLVHNPSLVQRNCSQVFPFHNRSKPQYAVAKHGGFHMRLLAAGVLRESDTESIFLTEHPLKRRKQATSSKSFTVTREALLAASNKSTEE